MPSTLSAYALGGFEAVPADVRVVGNRASDVEPETGCCVHQSGDQHPAEKATKYVRLGTSLRQT